MPLKQKLYCHTIGCKLGFAQKGIKRMLKNHFSAANIELTLEQYFLLNILDNQEGLILQELADIVDRDKSSVLRLINGLEDNSFVNRTTDPHDNRRKILLVTQAGSDVLAEARKLDQTVNDKITSQLTPQKLKELEEMLSNIYEKTIMESQG